MLLLDAQDPSRPGGTGRAWAWPWLAEARARGELADWPPIILAGGLDPSNVAQAIHAARPDAVDVASGVESSPRKKDPTKVRAFVRAALKALPTTP
jgi:phosphoribosylanthranilate isomerase